MFDLSNVVSAELIKGRKHKITLHVPTRPSDASELLGFYNKIAADFCKEYDCKFAGDLDVSLNHYNESSILVFFVKEFKPSSKKRHRNVHWI